MYMKQDILKKNYNDINCIRYKNKSNILQVYIMNIIFLM